MKQSIPFYITRIYLYSPIFSLHLPINYTNSFFLIYSKRRALVHVARNNVNTKELTYRHLSCATCPIFINSSQSSQQNEIPRDNVFRAPSVIQVSTCRDHPVARRQKARRKLPRFYLAIVGHNFSRIVHPFFPQATPFAPPFNSSRGHLLSAAIFRIRYLRSQLQISRIPRAGVPLDRTLSDTTTVPLLLGLPRRRRLRSLLPSFATLVSLDCRR